MVVFCIVKKGLFWGELSDLIAYEFIYWWFFPRLTAVLPPVLVPRQNEYSPRHTMLPFHGMDESSMPVNLNYSAYSEQQAGSPSTSIISSLHQHGGGGPISPAPSSASSGAAHSPHSPFAQRGKKKRRILSMDFFPCDTHTHSHTHWVSVVCRVCYVFAFGGRRVAYPWANRDHVSRRVLSWPARVLVLFCVEKRFSTNNSLSLVFPLSLFGVCRVTATLQSRP